MSVEGGAYGVSSEACANAVLKADGDDVRLSSRAENGRRPESSSREKKTQKSSSRSSAAEPPANTRCEPESIHPVIIRVRGFAVAEPGSTDDPEDFVSDVRCRIECWSEGGEKKAIGLIRGYLLDVERAISAGMPVYDLYDMHSQELSEFWSPLYQSAGNLEPAVVRLLGGRPRNRNVLVLAASEIEPAHRGKKFGLYAAGRIIEHLKMACGIAIGQPYPMQFGPAGEDEAWMRRFGRGLGGEFKSALTKLRRYWGQLGFRRIPGTDFYVVSTHRVHISANERER